MEERQSRGEKRTAVSLDMEMEEKDGTRAKSLHRRTRSQSLSTRARMGLSSGQSSRRGSTETLGVQIDGEKVKYDAEPFRLPRQPAAHYNSSDSVPSETELEADIERLRNEKIELDRTKAALEVQQAKLSELQIALDIERASNEKNLGEAVKQADRARWLEQEVEARNREMSDFMVEKDQMLRQMGKMSVDEKVAQLEIERLKKEVENLVHVSAKRSKKRTEGGG